MDNQFTAPSFADDFLRKVSSRCDILIKTGVWDFNNAKLRAWMKNFKGAEAQYLCAHLLDSLIYRSDRMTTSLCNHAIYSTLPNSLATYPDNITDWILRLRRPGATGFCFVAAEGINRKGERVSGKSGQTVLRKYDRSGVVHKSHFIDASHLLDRLNTNNYQHVVFIDDFCGTGTQFSDFYHHFEFSKIPQAVSQYYIPFACHEDAIFKKLNTETPLVKVAPVELLGEKNKFFFEKSGTFRGDKLNSVNTAKLFYQKLLTDNDINLDPFGFGSLELSYGWNMATPNNTLPIYYTDKSKWNPLLTR
jgi:hypothetical protein